MGVKSYRDLLVWQKSMALVEDTYRLTGCFSKNEEFGLKSQMRRAAVSVPSNIAEGKARNHPREFLQFLHIAMGSLSELETQVELAQRLGIISSDDARATFAICQEVGKMLHGLANVLNR
jgi:four helix bundle protein